MKNEPVINHEIDRENQVPTPPFWGAKCINEISLRAIVAYINKNTLYKFQWGYKANGKSQEEYAAWAKQEIDPVFNRLIRENEASKVIRPRAVYGYFPCLSDGDELIVFEDVNKEKERCRFSFPRQKKKRGLCISDFFRDINSSEIDVVGFQVATVGQPASDYAREIFERDDYQDYLYSHGLNVETTEGLAEYVHKHIRAELGFAMEDARAIKDLFKQRYRGARYSFGYPACPNLHDQVKLLELLDADKIDVRLGDEDQLWPEETTSAIIVHHPQAKYFST